jgi:hypothetical protein
MWGVPGPQGTNSGPRTHLGRGYEPAGGVNILSLCSLSESCTLGFPGSAAGGHNCGGGPPAGRGGVPAGGGLAGHRSGAPAGGRGGGLAGGSNPAPAPGKGKQARVVLDDDEVSSDEDEPLQKRLWQLSSAGPAVPDEAAMTMVAADKEATVKMAAEETTAEGPEKATRGRMNESQSKFLVGTWPMSQNQPNVPLF